MNKHLWMILPVFLMGLGVTSCGHDDKSASSKLSDGKHFDKFSCTVQWEQLWPKPNAADFTDMHHIEYVKEDVLLDLKKKEIELNESQMKPRGIDVSFSPNINNFKFTIKPNRDRETISDAGYDPEHFSMLTIELINVVRNFERNVKVSTTSFVDRRLETFRLNEELAFGPKRKNVGAAQQAEDDFEESGVFTKDAPAVTASFVCKAKPEDDGSDVG